MNKDYWEEILRDAAAGDIFTARDYNLDYALSISLTVKEIRAIHSILRKYHELRKEIRRIKTFREY